MFLLIKKRLLNNSKLQLIYRNSVDAVMIVALMLMNGVGTLVDKNAAISLFRNYVDVKAIAVENYFKLLNEGVPDSNDHYSIQLDESTNELMKCDPSVIIDKRDRDSLYK